MADMTLEDVLERLERVEQRGNEYQALCPAHADQLQSLMVRETGDDEVLVHCMAGCDFSDIMDAITSRDAPDSPIKINYKSKGKKTSSPGVPVHSNPSAWWADHTKIPISLWEEWGVDVSDKGVVFHYPGTGVSKVRAPDLINEFRQKVKRTWWEGIGSRFAVWPFVPDEMPETIYLTEGESDWGPLKACGYPVWAITTGAAAQVDPEIFRSLFDRGVKTILLAFDDDHGGKRGIAKLVPIIRAAGIRTYILPIAGIRDPLKSEKDILDVWKRVGDIEDFTQMIDEISYRAVKNQPLGIRSSLDDLLQMNLTAPLWLVEDIWLDGSFGFFVGPPKTSKSIVALELALSVASGTPFLGEFNVPEAGPVVFIGKEDSDFALQDRARRLVLQKDLGGQSSGHSVVLPQTQRIPLHFDLSRDFTFTDDAMVSLISWCRDIETHEGQPVKLIIIDPLLRCISGDVDIFNASSVNDEIIRRIVELKQATGAAVMVVHHNRKASTESVDPMSGWYGSVMFFLSSESYISIPAGKDDDGWFRVDSGTKNSAELDWKYQVTFTEDGIEIPIITGEDNHLEGSGVQINYKNGKDSLSREEAIVLSQGFPEAQALYDRGEIRQNCNWPASFAELTELLDGLVKKNRLHSEDHRGEVFYSKE